MLKFEKIDMVSHFYLIFHYHGHPGLLKVGKKNTAEQGHYINTWLLGEAFFRLVWGMTWDSWWLQRGVYRRKPTAHVGLQ